MSARASIRTFGNFRGMGNNGGLSDAEKKKTIDAIHFLGERDKGQFCCPGCPKKFRSWVDLNNHFGQESKHRSCQWSCSLCRNEFRSPKDAFSHVREVCTRRDEILW